MVLIQFLPVIKSILLAWFQFIVSDTFAELAQNIDHRTFF